MYLMKPDIEFLNDWLNQEEEIAFLLSNGDKKWIAKKQHFILPDIGTQKFGEGYDFNIPNFVEYNLWHIPSGPLPFLGENKSVKLIFKKEDWKDEAYIPNPWFGWTELRTGANERIPYFGAGHPGIIHLEIKLNDDDGGIPMSGFGWIGNHYKIIGNAAEETTEKFWNRLKKMAKKVGKQIPRGNNTNCRNEIFAFPAAYAEIQNGRPCADNP